jgi:hypothetical protein
VGRVTLLALLAWLFHITRPCQTSLFHRRATTLSASYSSTHQANAGTWLTVIVIEIMAAAKDDRGSGNPGSLEAGVGFMALIAN